MSGVPALGSTWRKEVADLLRPDPSANLPIPAYSGRSLPNVAASVVRAVGADATGAPPYLPPLDRGLDPFDGGRPEGPVVVLLADGFGGSAFERWAAGPETAYGSRWAALARPITTVFPTTTVSALVSLSTATAPSQHGIVGYRQFLPRFGVVADMLRLSPVGVGPSETLVGADWTPSMVSGAPTVFRRGLRGAAVSREKFADQAFTRLLYDGAEYVPYATASELAHQLVLLLERATPPPVIYAYWDELDTIHHRHGPADTTFDFEADRLAHLVEHVARRVDPARARTTTVLVTADHGQVPTDPARQVRVDLVPGIARAMGRPLAGDRRAGFLTALPGARAELEAALEAHLPAGYRVVPMSDALRWGLFGPPPFHPEIEARLGDLLVLAPTPGGLTSLPPGARPSPRGDLLGGHGGLAPEELIVPLVAGRLCDFGPPLGRPAEPRRQP